MIWHDVSEGPPVPYLPETLAALRARYPAALDFVYDALAIKDAAAVRPGEVAANVFDFEDGLRLLVSREKMPDGRIVLHVSASVRPGSRMRDDLIRLAGKLGEERPGNKTARSWAAGIPERFRQLAGGPSLELLGWSARGIPHWHGTDPGNPA